MIELFILILLNAPKKIMKKFDVIVVGGGIVGLATALRLLQKNTSLKVLLLEKENGLAKHQTGNNSGVIHSGIYYKPGSLKAQNCKEGYDDLVHFARENDIAHEICGKVIVATREDEIPALEELHRRGDANGLTGINRINSEQIKEREPHVNGITGLWVPQTGIIDFKQTCQKYAEKIQYLGGQILLNTKVISILEDNDHVEVITDKGTYEGAYLISCAGLQSDRVAKMTEPDLPLRITPFRGEYYMLKPEKQYLVKNLIYPVPDPACPFLGVHFTRMVRGGIEAGPNAVFAFKREGYTRTSFSLKDTYDALTWPGFLKVAAKYWKTGFGEFYRSFSKQAFVKALQRLIPEIQANDLVPGGAGVRAQACARDGKLLDDFSIHSQNRCIHVCNAPSPAATASLAIGSKIADTLIEKSSLKHHITN